MVSMLVDALKEKRLMFGEKEIGKSLLLSSKDISEVFLSANCDNELRNKIKSLAGISNVKVTELSHTAEEIGAACKKTFAITVSAIKKE